MKSFKQHLNENYGSAFEKAKAIAKYMTGQRETKYLAALDIFAKGYADKQLYNANFGENYSYGFSRGLEAAYESLFDKHREELRGMLTNEEYWDVMGVNPQSISKVYKIFAKYPKTPHEIKEFMEAIKDMPAAIKELKTYIVKGRIPKPVDPNVFVKPMAPYEAQKMAMKFLQEAVDSFKVAYEASVRKQFTADFDRIKGLSDPKDFKKLNDADKGFAAMFFMRDGYRVDSPFILKPDPQERLERLIKDAVDEVIGHFVAKNTSKLASIFAKKAEVSEHKILKTRIQNAMLENDMYFAFPDGSSFVITSQVIYKRSPTGKLFTQYPTRFTDVIMADGKRMASPNEEKMIKEF